MRRAGQNPTDVEVQDMINKVGWLESLYEQSCPCVGWWLVRRCRSVIITSKVTLSIGEPCLILYLVMTSCCI